jgi:hypothetical protein
MKTRHGALVLALAVALGGCASQVPPTPIATPSAPTAVRVIDPYDLRTHCGIREARVGHDYFVATPPMGDGNPPSEWGNPDQTGTMTVYDDGTARFSAGDLTATFTVRAGATAWLGPPCQ